jgi:hypothetical protein
LAPLFALTLFVSAALLFVLQPMVAKAVLPLLGGSPAVWSTCMVFFQSALLAGYAYAHFITSRLALRRQVLIHAGLLLLPLWYLPLTFGAASDTPGAVSARPVFWLLGLLGSAVGIPFFAVATTAPLLQRWFSETHSPGARDPYYLYGASNLGSLLALLSYPFLIEPNIPLGRQSALWTGGYLILAALALVCAVVVWNTPRAEGLHDALHSTARPSRQHWLRWLVLAFVPSSWMLGVTAYLSTDIAPVPLLWVVPLSLYLLTFVVAFARRPIVPHARAVGALPWLVVPLAIVMGFGLVQPYWIALHVAAFAVGALVCHGELARLRPSGEHATSFYLALATGGALGGAFNAIIAPLVFNRLAEYPLAVILACLAVSSNVPGGGLVSARGMQAPRDDDRSIVTNLGLRTAFLPLLVLGLTAILVKGGSESLLGIAATIVDAGLLVLACATQRSRPVRFALAIGAAWLASGMAAGIDGRELFRRRSFFGVSRVTEVADGTVHRLFLGTTLHGQQCFEPGREEEPLTYFTRTGPVGQVFGNAPWRNGSSSVAVIGLGAGSLAAYAGAGERWDFYEIDPVVASIARDPRYFTYLQRSRAAPLSVILGDARMRLRDAPAHGYGLIVFDAFSSDAVPTHLLTREALALYRDKLTRGGILAFDITNRYLDLEPVIGALARDVGWAALIRADLDVLRAEKDAGKQPSIWSVMAANRSDLGLLVTDRRWHPPRVSASERVWTDDYSNLARHFGRYRRPNPGAP